MANKRVTIASATVDPNKLVYADLDITAIQSTRHYLTPINEQLSALSVDLLADNKVTLEMLLGNTLNSEDDSTPKVEPTLMFQLEKQINPYIYRFNEEQSRRSRLKLTTNINVRAIQQAIHNIFSWTPGERILNPEFGSKLRQYLYEGITAYNTEQIMAEIRHCFEEWEPRARLDQVINMTNTEDIENNTVRLDIIYSIPSLTTEQYRYTIEVEKPV